MFWKTKPDAATPRRDEAPPRGEAPPDCRRASPRLNQRDREASIVCRGTKAKIRVLNLSQTGIMAECKAQPAVGERVEIVLDGAEPVAATTLWVKGRRFGAAFAAPLAFEALWSHAPGPRAAQPARSASDRIVVDAVAAVRHDGAAMRGRIRNVSVRGMLIETPASLQPGQVVEVEVKGWPAVEGAVMWSRDGSAGLHLEQPLTEEQILDLKMAR